MRVTTTATKLYESPLLYYGRKLWAVGQFGRNAGLEAKENRQKPAKVSAHQTILSFRHHMIITSKAILVDNGQNFYLISHGFASLWLWCVRASNTSILEALKIIVTERYHH
jgi:hypothetical protein